MTNKIMKIRWFDAANRDITIKEVKVKKFFEAAGRKCAICDTHKQTRFCYAYDYATGCEIPAAQIQRARTLKDKIMITQEFANKHFATANWHLYDVINH